METVSQHYLTIHIAEDVTELWFIKSKTAFFFPVFWQSNCKIMFPYTLVYANDNIPMNGKCVRPMDDTRWILPQHISKKYNYHVNWIGESLDWFQIHMRFVLDLFLSNQDSSEVAAPLSPFQLQLLHLFHGQIPKDVIGHEPT